MGLSKRLQVAGSDIRPVKMNLQAETQYSSGSRSKEKIGSAVSSKGPVSYTSVAENGPDEFSGTFKVAAHQPPQPGLNRSSTSFVPDASIMTYFISLRSLPAL